MLVPTIPSNLTLNDHYPQLFQSQGYIAAAPASMQFNGRCCSSDRSNDETFLSLIFLLEGKGVELVNVLHIAYRKYDDPRKINIPYCRNIPCLNISEGMGPRSSII